MNRFTILKTSWGIAIFYNIKELLNFEKDNDTYEVSFNFFKNERKSY